MDSSSQVIEPEELRISTADGYVVSALRYAATGAPKANLIVAGATGVPQSIYRRFAEFANRRGYTVLTLDYRGIGRSKPATLKGFEMDYMDWATLDLNAAVELMATESLPLFMVGHSFGGHAFGLLEDSTKVRRFYTFGTGAGWHGWMPFLEQIKVLIMWHVVGPVITRRKGYLAWKQLGFGEDLPLGVFTQWKHWCRYPQYFFDDPEEGAFAKQFAKVLTPIVAANALDDLWASPRSRDAFMWGYKNAPLQTVDIDPKTLGLASLGHMGYFRAEASPLWTNVLDWFDEALPSTA